MPKETQTTPGEQFLPENILCGYMETLEKDVARYRWLRDNGYIVSFKRGNEVDAIVDAEMAKPKEEIIF